MARSISSASRTPTGVNSTPKRRRDGLDSGKATEPGRHRGVPNDGHARHAGRDLFEQLQPFPAHAEFGRGKTVALPPGRARLATKPPPTGSIVVTNTIGTVRLACCSAPTIDAGSS